MEMCAQDNILQTEILVIIFSETSTALSLKICGNAYDYW